MAAAPKTQRLTREEWNAHALELARARHLDGTATFLGTYTAGDGSTPICWHVPSHDRSGRYTVELDERTGVITCHCTAASYGRPCAHAGAVVHALQQRQRALAGSEGDTALRWFAQSTGALSGEEW